MTCKQGKNLKGIANNAETLKGGCRFQRVNCNCSEVLLLGEQIGEQCYY